MPSPLDDPRVYLSVERTFLAWIRTGLAMMGFGFVVARFGLFLREIEAAGRGPVQPPHVMSTRFGTALVVLGVALSAAAVVRYVRLLKRLASGETLLHPSHLAVGLGLALALAGAAVSAYLIATAWPL